MPLFDYQCESCGHVCEVLVPKSDTQVVCQVCSGRLPTLMTKLPAAPSFKVNGYNQMTGYAGDQTRVQHHGNGVRTEVKGNFEAFDRLT